MGLDPKWKKFEKIVAGIHVLKSEGADVKFDDHIIGKRTGRKRQIDVSIRFNHGYYGYLAVVECKDYGARVSMEKVEAFRTKLEDVGAMRGIMVSPHGFQEGAIKTAQAYNIELFTLTEVKSDWTIVLVKLLRNGICFIRSIATRRPIERGGKLFLTDARRILQDVDKAKLRAERIAQRKAGTLRIDIATAVSWHVLVVDSFANCGVGSQRWRWSCSICFVLDLRMLRCQRT